MQLDDTLRKGFRLGDWLVRPIEGVVVGAKESRHLQPKTMDVLVSLAESSGQVLTRDELILRVWGPNAVSDEPLTRCIHELRRALDDDRGEPTFIQTIPKRGYRLLAEVRELSAADEFLLEGQTPGENPLRQVTRQRVLWVGLGYAALAWVFAELVRFAERQAGAELAAPDWLMPALVIILLLGFPVAVFLAWFQQVRREGPGSALTESGTLRGMRMLLWSRRGIDMVLVTLVIAVLAGFALDLMPSSGARATSLLRPALAVLPFDTAGDAVAAEWLGKGMAEDLHAGLAQQQGLLTSSISTSFRNSLETQTAQQIGHELNVQYLLRGLVVRSGDQLRVRAELIDTITGLEVWDAAYSREADKVFSIQQDIVNGILAQLDLPSVETADLIPVSMVAYDSYLRGRNLLRSANTATAAADAALWFRQALATDSRMPMARNALCEAYVREMQLGGEDGIYGRANSACAEALLQSPDSSAAHLALADFYRVSKHPQEAVTEYEWVLRRQADNPAAWYGLAQAHAGLNQSAEAEDAYRRVLEIKPDWADAYADFVALLISQGRYTEALELSRILVRLDSERVEAYQYLATALFMNGNFRAAITASREVLRRDIGRHSAIMQIAHSHYFLGNYTNAINIYTQAARLMPDDYETHGGLGAAYLQLDESDGERQAMQAFARARYLAERRLLSEPGDVRTMTDLAYYCAALGDQLCAQRRLAEALELAPDDFRTHYIAALVHVSNGDLRSAGIAAQRALALGYPEVLISTDPLLASTWSERRPVILSLTAIF